MLRYGGKDMLKTRHEKIKSWDDLNMKLKDQFLQQWLMLHERNWLVCEYVQEFSSLILNIKNMYEEDKQINFLDGLHNWPRAKLQRAKPKDLASATYILIV